MDDLKISNSLSVVKKSFTGQNLLNFQNYLNIQTIDGDEKSIAEMEEWLSDARSGKQMRVIFKRDIAAKGSGFEPLAAMWE